MKGSVKLMGKKRFIPEYKEEIIKLVTEREMIYKFIKKYRSEFRVSEDVPGFRSIKELIL